MQLPIVKWGNSAALRLPTTLLGQLSAKIGDVFEADLTSEPGAIVLRKSIQGVSVDSAVEAMKFAIKTDEGIEFLRCWLDADFAAIRKEWPDAPITVFVGADPLHKPTNAGG